MDPLGLEVLTKKAMQNSEIPGQRAVRAQGGKGWRLDEDFQPFLFLHQRVMCNFFG